MTQILKTRCSDKLPIRSKVVVKKTELRNVPSTSIFDVITQVTIIGTTPLRHPLKCSKYFPREP